MPHSAILDRAEPSAETFTATMMTAVLRGAAVFWGVAWLVVVPFLAANKGGSAYLAAWGIVSTLLAPYLLLRRGRAVLSAWVFLTGGAFTATILTLLTQGGINNAGVTGQLAFAVIAAVVLGRRAAAWVAGSCLAADLGNVIAELSGHPLPVMFPGAPFSIWVVMVIFFVITAFPLDRAIRMWRGATEQLQSQLAERRKAEDQIRYHEQLIDQSADPVMAADNNMIVTYWNAAASRLFGWSREEAVGRNLEEVTHFAASGLPRKKLRDELAQTGQFHGEIAMLTRAGSTVIIDAAINLLRNAAGEPIGTVGGLRNITERRAAEEALKRSEERLRLIAETAPVGIMVLDLSGRVVFVNSLVTQVMGSEISGRHHDDPEFQITDFAGNPLPPEQRPFLRALATRQRVIDSNFVVRKAGGQRAYLSVSAAPIMGAGGEPEGVVAVLEDITARRELEERYLHAQKMESMGRLAGGVAHDFNNLLTAINGYSTMLLRDADLADPVRAKIEQILKAGEGAAELCQQLLAFSRKQGAEPMLLAANEAVQDVEKILLHALGDDIILTTNLDPAAGTILTGAGQLQQALLNLGVNARDAMPHGGHLKISTANTQSVPDGAPAGTPSAAYVQVTVTDTGVGMDQDTRERILEPFFTTKPSGKGTGLGLATVNEMVRQNGGWLRVESEPGIGTKFSLFLPRVEAGPIAPPSQPEVTPEGGTETLLVVEDHASLRRLLVECLQSYGYNVMDAASGSEALELFDSSDARVDLVITDMSMPGMSGNKLIEALEARWPGVRALVLSGYSEEQVAALGIAGARFAVLTKPASVPEIAAAVRSLLDQKGMNAQAEVLHEG